MDDAIVVGESIFTHRQRGLPPLEAAIEGARDVGLPVVLAVLTSVVAFLPLVFVPGVFGRVMGVVPRIVVTVLLISLVESLLILPRHLSHLPTEGAGRRGGPWTRFQDRFAGALERFVGTRYRPFLERALVWRYATLATGVATLLVTLGLVRGGIVQVGFFPSIDADNVAALVSFPLGTPVEVTEEAVGRLERSGRALGEELAEEAREAGRSPEVVRHVLASVGAQPFRSDQQRRTGSRSRGGEGGHVGEVNLELAESDRRGIGSAELARRWRARAGRIPGAEELVFTTSLFAAGSDIHVRLVGPSLEELRAGAEELKEALRRIQGVREITDSFREGKRELELEVTPAAEALGLTQTDLARQVRQAFHGEEAQRVQRGRDDVKVMVRFPETRRRSVGDLESMRIRARDGTEVPLLTVARIRESRGFATIPRVDRHRIVDVTASIDTDEGVGQRANAIDVLGELERDVLPGILLRHPGLGYTFEGQQREQGLAAGGISRGFAVALLGIYALLALAFRSYLQPLIVMTAIPFGLVGAVWGHALLGLDLSVSSMFGLVAVMGVVVNDSLVLVTFVNRERERRASLAEAIREAGVARFRPIVLTSLTTFAGLTPILLERSLQARFLIPLAAALAFGVLFATVITLVLVPVSYLILEDLRAVAGRGLSWSLGRSPRPLEESP